MSVWIEGLRQKEESGVMKRPSQDAVRVSCGILFLVSTFCCSSPLRKLETKLPPDYAAFLSTVQPIITGPEEKTFLKLPDSEKDRFIEEFWKRRDPEPETEENEFKTEYLKRVAEAGRLFAREGKPGWLTDRGRIYVLFGPPTDRIINTLGEDPAGRCSEVWYYGNFPVLFRDPTCLGSYKLVTYDLTSLRDRNLTYMQDLNRAQAQAMAEAQGLKTFRTEGVFLDFTWQVEKKVVEPGRIEGTVGFAIPYPAIWFRAEEGIFKTVIETSLELRAADKALLWEYEDAFEITIQEDELKEKQTASFRREIPFAIEESEKIERLRRGKATFRIRLKNRTGQEELTKSLEFDF
jgi:GWxTD domain-containing protein